ncbi:hypothetical protein LB521_04370 [Mesorhizobium sp. BR-1-1-8]|uniref:hypothetical protein n=1 Tax=Mesorhizobium sp. BR-1-1-8 TaxID=2876659 RepID=UPI001CCB86F4|nr:hypothetical protein [Mesorhizobium sp. BR-1-1-8]MBZ9980381.1 hypothetical protein [Mesorhizobium sp. BR-1-1-8]
MTPEQMVYLVLAVAGAVGGAYWRFSTVLSAVKDELAAHKVHTAETYVTKAGMQEQTNALMRAIESIGSRIDSMSERLDRVFEAKPDRRAG